MTLLLHSEERMEWIYENPDFAKQWGTLLKRGSRIVIVHTINRSFVYAAGAIEPYYTSRLQRFQRVSGKSQEVAVYAE